MGVLDLFRLDGRRALVIANAPRLPEAIIGGKERKTGRTGPGMLFLNGKGDECGGLVYTVVLCGHRDVRLEFLAHLLV